MRFDDILDDIGDFGRFQRLQYGLSGASIVLAGMFSLSMVFIGFTPQHYCQPAQHIVSEWNNLTTVFDNGSRGGGAGVREILGEITLTDFYVPSTLEGDRNHYNRCYTYDYSANSTTLTSIVNVWLAQQLQFESPANESSNSSQWAQSSLAARRSALNSLLKQHLTTSVCNNGWQYSTNYFSRSIVVKWDMVCSDFWRVSLVKMVFFAGRLLGSYLFGMLGDRFGRRPVLLGNFASLAVCALGCAFAPNLIIFCSIFLIQGAMQAGLSATAYVYACEVVGPRKRLLLGTSVQAFFPIGYLLLTAIAYFVRDFFWIEIALFVPSALLFVLYWFLVVESPRWLITRGRQRDAVRVLCRAARENRSNVTDQRIEELVEQVIRDGPRSHFMTSDQRSSFIDVQEEENADGIATRLSHPHKSRRKMSEHRSSVGPGSITASVHDLPKLTLADDEDMRSCSCPTQAVERPSDTPRSSRRGDKSLTSSCARIPGSIVQLNDVPAPAGGVEQPEAETVRNKCGNENLACKHHTYSIIDLFRNWYITKITIATWFSFFVGANAYYGLSLIADQLDGNPYVNFALTGVMELPACAAAVGLAARIGRIRTVMFSCLLGAVACLASAFVTQRIAQLVVALSGKLLVTIAYDVICLIASEVFPTVVRNLGYGAAGVCARIGGMIAPLLFNFPVEQAFLFFACFLLADSVACWVLPDYGKRQLPETLEELLPRRSADKDCQTSSRIHRSLANRLVIISKRLWHTCVKICCGCVELDRRNSSSVDQRVAQGGDGKRDCEQLLVASTSNNTVLAVNGHLSTETGQSVQVLTLQPTST